MSQSDIYFVLGNSLDPCGQEDFINGLRNIFDKAIYESYGLEWPYELESTVVLSQTVIPGAINIFMEDFSSDFVEHLAEIRRKNPRTHYVFILTEFPTVSDHGYVSFNSFTRVEQIWSMVIRLINFQAIVPTDKDKTVEKFTRGLSLKKHGDRRGSRRYIWRLLFQKQSRSILGYVLSIRYIFSFVRKCLGDVSRPVDRLSYEKRLASLLRIRDEASLFLVTHPELIKMYDRLSFGPIEEFPLLFSSTPIEAIPCRPNSIFFSGNLTKYRAKQLGVLRESLFGPYKQYQYIEEVLDLVFEYLALQSVDRNKLKAILDDGLSVYIPPEKLIDLFGNEDEKGDNVVGNIDLVQEIISVFSPHYPPIMVVALAYTNLWSIKALPRYEIYVPQANNWKWSSPVRTFRSLYHGLHPINFGEFSDHDIASIASQAKDGKELKIMLEKGGDNGELLIRVRRYHQKIHPAAKRVGKCILELAGEKRK